MISDESVSKVIFQRLSPIDTRKGLGDFRSQVSKAIRLSLFQYGFESISKGLITFFQVINVLNHKVNDGIEFGGDFDDEKYTYGKYGKTYKMKGQYHGWFSRGVHNTPFIFTTESNRQDDTHQVIEESPNYRT